MFAIIVGLIYLRKVEFVGFAIQAVFFGGGFCEIYLWL